MEPGGSMPHSPGLSNDPSLEQNQPNFSYWKLFILLLLRLGLNKGIFPVDILVKILEALLPKLFSLCRAYIYLLDAFILTTLGERYKVVNFLL